jgi:hypothetical protein
VRFGALGTSQQVSCLNRLSVGIRLYAYARAVGQDISISTTPVTTSRYRPFAAPCTETTEVRTKNIAFCTVVPPQDSYRRS